MTAPLVIVDGGHMIDDADRATPRFPPDQEERVTRAVGEVFDAWAVGAGTTLVCGGARGADIICAEQALARGAAVRVRLAYPRDRFVAESVALPATSWRDRFGHLMERCDVDTLPERADDSRGGAFAATNQWIVDEATAQANGPPHGVVVWDGAKGDGAGGTADLVDRLGCQEAGSRVAVVDPTPRGYEARQTAAGPKRLLSLDGGGIRGVLSLEILDAIESQLRLHTGTPDLRLGDYFDYIAGTSTGAVIAAALALGKSVGEIRDLYEKLGAAVFRKNGWLRRVFSLYPDAPLTQQLKAVIGEGRTLGDSELRSLLLVVLHNSETDSPWPVSNCTSAKYNRGDRNLQAHPDRNLDIPLTDLLRGSTAAPIYFRPQTLKVGQHEFEFQDGGITPFNNPAFLLYLMATRPEYHLAWPSGADRLLLVSVGTGASAATHPGLTRRKVHLLFNARNLPPVFMNGASVGQDLACRAVGSCRFGMKLDREVGDMVDTAGTEPGMFTYLRYNADLSDDALRKAGVTDGKTQKAVRKLDRVDCIPVLQDLGRRVGAEVDIAHFDGFT